MISVPLHSKLEPSIHLAQLIRLLQNAHAGELAAARAYWGHSHSLFVRDSKEKSEILKIYHEELHHRERLNIMIKSLEASPRPFRECAMNFIGLVIGFLCLWGGWFVPMHGAGKLESTNVMEYLVAAQLAFLSKQHHLVEELLTFAEVEWDHENYFYNKASGHWLFPISPKWKRPPQKSEIRLQFKKFQELHH